MKNKILFYSVRGRMIIEVEKIPKFGTLNLG